MHHPRGRRLRSALAAVVALLSAPIAAAAEASEPPHSIITPQAERSLLLDAAFAGDHIVAVGERGHVLRTKDGGASWRQVPVPTRAMLTAVSFHGAELGVAVGHDATVLRTVDGGRNWQRVYFQPEEERPFLDVYFHDAHNLTAVGAYGYFLESRDGGETWDPREFAAVDHGMQPVPADPGEMYPEDFHFNRFVVSDTKRWYMAAEAGNIYRTDDRGVTWQRLPSPYEGSFMGALPMGGDRLLIYGLQGKLFLTGDAGVSWRAVATGTMATLSDAVLMGDGRVLVSGYSGALLVADPEMYEVRLIQLEERMGISSLLHLKDGNVLLFGTGGVMRVPPEVLSSDGGAG